METKKKRSFRLSQLQGDVVKFALLYFINAVDGKNSPLAQTYKTKAEELYNKLDNYEWEVIK